MNFHPLMGVPPGESSTLGTSHPQQTNHITKTGSTPAQIGFSSPQASFSPPHIAYSPPHTQAFGGQGPHTVYYAPPCHIQAIKVIYIIPPKPRIYNLYLQ